MPTKVTTIVVSTNSTNAGLERWVDLKSVGVIGSARAVSRTSLADALRKLADHLDEMYPGAVKP